MKEVFISTRLTKHPDYPFKVSVTNSGCIIPFTHKQRNRGGYSIVSRYKNGRYKDFLVHRLCYEAYKGTIPKGMIVRHTCDNPPCINPQHLLLGTHADNIRDMVERGRARGGNSNLKGEDNGNSKLTKKQVKEMRELWDSGLFTRRTLGQFFGVNGRYTRRITNYELWKHI